MPRKGHTAEQIISILRQVEVEQSKGKTVEVNKRGQANIQHFRFAKKL